MMIRALGVLAPTAIAKTQFAGRGEQKKPIVVALKAPYMGIVYDELKNDPRIQWGGHFSDMQAAEDGLARVKPDVILIGSRYSPNDFTLTPALSVANYFKQLLARNQKLPAVIIHADNPGAVEQSYRQTFGDKAMSMATIPEPIQADSLQIDDEELILRIQQADPFKTT